MQKIIVTPLSGGFMMIAIIGFFVSFYKVYGWNKDWGVAFMILFAVMLAASVYSFIKLEEDAIAEMERKKRL